jgi:D-amino-acid dehydrogenase
MKVIIIGGGVIGLCTAWYLSKEGYEVTVIDNGDITTGCSFGNMGYISPSHFIPLATPGIITQGLKWMLRSSSPFYIKPRLSIDLVKWGMAFWRSANTKTVERNAPHLNHLLQLSRQLVADMKTELPGSFDLIEKGCLMLYKSEKTGDHEKHLAEEAALFGLKTTTFDRNGIQQLEPETEVDVTGGVLYTDDCHLNPAKLMHTLYHFLKEKGVKFVLNTAVNGFEKNGNVVSSIITTTGKYEADAFVLANGSWLPQTARLLGIKLLLQPGKGYSFVNEGLEKNLHYPSILVDARVATTPINRWLRIGGTMELGAHENRVLPNRVKSIYEAFKTYYPNINIPFPEEKSIWYGYRPVTPDGLPHIGRTEKYMNLLIAGGHAMLGVSAAAATGLLISEMVAMNKTTIDIAAFKPERF